MLGSITADPLRDKVEEKSLGKRTSWRKSSSCLLDSPSFDCLIDHCNPFVKAAEVKTAERLSKRKVTNDIESREVEPVYLKWSDNITDQY